MLLENRFMLTCRSNNFLWHSESSIAVTLLLHTDWMMLKNSSNQGGANTMTLAPWHMKSRPRMLVASKAVVFLENYLAVSTWILNGSSIECLEKKYQPFSLAGVWFRSRVNQISGLKSAWHRSGLCLTLLLCNCCYKRSLRNNPRNQTNIFRLNFTLTMLRSQSCIIKSFLQGLRFKIWWHLMTSINEREIPDYHAHLLFHSYTVVFFATKFVIGFHAL